MGRLSDDTARDAFVCVHVWRAGQPVTRVLHAPTGMWAFTCDGEHARGDAVATRVGELVARDATLDELGDMPRGSEAQRAGPGEPWRVAPLAVEPPPPERGGGKVIPIVRAVLRRLTGGLVGGRGRPSDEQIRDVIARAGWMVLTVAGDESGPPFAYTIGLFHSYRHPELIMFSPRADAAGPMLNACGAKVKAGATLTEDTLLDEVMANHRVGFRAFGLARYPDHLGRAIDFYGGPFPALQVCWPDRHGRFPWDPDCVREVRDIQPLG